MKTAVDIASFPVLRRLVTFLDVLQIPATESKRFDAKIKVFVFYFMF